MEKIFYLYIITNVTNNIFYIGVTSDLLKRTYEHRNGFGSKFTAKYKVYKLVYYEVSEDMYHIFYREILMKKWKRQWKIELINNFNPSWIDLFNKIN